MTKHPIHLIALLIIGTTLLSGCAKNDSIIDYGKGDSIIDYGKGDSIIDYGKGDSIRLVGGADNFDCDDPNYANVKKVRTWTMQFVDGTTKYLCSLEGTASTQ